MDDDRIIELFNRGLEKLLDVDKWLLTHNLNEPCISHRIAMHLTQRFNEYDVDCEYNGDIDRGGGRKRIHYIKEHLDQLINGTPITGEEIREVSVFPDIIIHKRGSNENNLCIIEVKKSTNTNDFNFDRIKLQAYTSEHYGNNLNYQIGFFVVLNTNNDNPSFTLEIYKNGQILNQAN